MDNAERRALGARLRPAQPALRNLRAMRYLPCRAWLLASVPVLPRCSPSRCSPSTPPAPVRRSTSATAASWSTAVHVLGIPHPTGYPLYVLLGKLWTVLVPVGSIAYRLSLFSAACAALACALVYRAATAARSAAAGGAAQRAAARLRAELLGRGQRPARVRAQCAVRRARDARRAALGCDPRPALVRGDLLRLRPRRDQPHVHGRLCRRVRACRGAARRRVAPAAPGSAPRCASSGWCGAGAGAVEAPSAVCCGRLAAAAFAARARLAAVPLPAAAFARRSAARLGRSGDARALPRRRSAPRLLGPRLVRGARPTCCRSPATISPAFGAELTWAGAALAVVGLVAGRRARAGRACSARS